MVIERVDPIHRTFPKETPAAREKGQNNKNKNTSGKQKQNDPWHPNTTSEVSENPLCRQERRHFPNRGQQWLRMAGQHNKAMFRPALPRSLGTEYMILQHSSDTKDDKLNRLHLGKTMKRDLIPAKASDSLQETGILSNQEGNMLLYTRSGLQNLDFDLHQASIIEAVQ